MDATLDRGASRPSGWRWRRDSSCPMPPPFLRGDAMLIDYETALRFWRLVDRRKRNQCWLWRTKTKRAPQFCVTMDGRRVVLSARRLAWYLHYGCTPERFVWPACGNKHCMSPEHLRTGSKGYRSDAVRGENHGATRTTAADAVRMRLMYLQGQRTQQYIADQYGISRSAVCDIVNYKTWAHTTKRRVACEG